MPITKRRKPPADVHPVQAGTTYTYDGVEYTVKPACDKLNHGRWMCITHGEPFQNQLQKDFHIGDGKRHELVWLCFDHGSEQP